MPKVSEAHVEARRQQIMEAAVRCFARDGFHRATMQDICAESGLSPGAIYRYFTSKEELVAAMSRDGLDREIALVEQIRREDNTLAVLDQLIETFFPWLDEADSRDEIRCQLALWTESLREPVIQEVAIRARNAYKDQFAAIIRRGQEKGDINRELEPQAVAGVMCSLYQGMVLQKALDPRTDVKSYTDAMRALFSGRFWTGRTGKKA